MTTDEQPRPGDSVLDTLGRRTGEVARVTLPGDESEVLKPDVPEKGRLERQRGSYQVLGEIARGGMGTILRGHDSDLGRDVAIKVLDERLADRPEVLQRFVEEAQIGGQLQHPGVVPVYELGLMADERPFFAMKLVKGRTLSALIERADSLADERRQLLGIFEGVCQTVAYAHSKGVVHRDLKPANVMVGAFGEVQVVDWGLAKVLGRGGVADEERALASRTVIETVRSGSGSGSDSLAGSVMGTPAYMPPEQARGEVDALDERCDVFALGAVLCELLTGKPPYQERADAGVLEQAARADLAQARARLEECGAAPELLQLCTDCLAPAATARPRNAERVARRVHTFLAAAEKRAQEARLEAQTERLRATQERKARRLTGALAVAVVLLLATAGGGYLWLDSQRTGRRADLAKRVDEAHEEARGLLAGGRWDEADARAREALELVDSNDAGLELRERTQTFSTRTAHAAQLGREREALAARNAELFARIDTIRAAPVLTTGEEADAAFAAAFRDYGIDLDSPDLEPALAALVERGMGEELALAIDEWGRQKRKSEGWDSPMAVAMAAIAADLDPDVLRNEMREALMERDEQRLLAFATRDNVRRLPPSTLWTLALALEDTGQSDASREVLVEATRCHPDDFRLRILAGFATGRRDNVRPINRTSIDHFIAAQTIRPDDETANRWIAEMGLAVGEFPRAIDAMERVIEVHGAQRGDLDYLGLLNLLIGDAEAAVAAYERSLEDGPLDVFSLAHYHAARFTAGHISGAQLLALHPQLPANPYVNLVFASQLCHQSDPARRDYRAALALCEAADTGSAWTWLERDCLATAYHALGRHADALEVIGRTRRVDELRPDGALMYACSSASIRRAMGQPELAREWYDRAVNLAEELFRGETGRWEGSFALAAFRRAEATFGR